MDLETKCPPKVKVFLWILFKKASLTWNELQKGRWAGPNIRVLCKGDAETANHILLEWAYSKYVWDTCARKFGVNININLNDNIWLTLGNKRGTTCGRLGLLLQHIVGPNGERTVELLMIHATLCIIIFAILCMILFFGQVRRHVATLRWLRGEWASEYIAIFGVVVYLWGMGSEDWLVVRRCEG